MLQEETNLSTRQMVVKPQPNSDLGALMSDSLFDKLQSRWTQARQANRPFIIALTGASGSGKSTLARSLANSSKAELGLASLLHLQDHYYLNLETLFEGWDPQVFLETINLDDPRYIDRSRLIEDLSLLKEAAVGSQMSLPQFQFGTPTRLPRRLKEELNVKVPPLILTEGIHSLYFHELRPFYDFSLYIEVPEAQRRQRWLHRNLAENRGTHDSMWENSVDALTHHIRGSQIHADWTMVNEKSEAEELNRLLSLLRSLEQGL